MVEVETEFKFWTNYKGFALMLMLSVVTVYAFCAHCWTFEEIPWVYLIESAAVWMVLGYGNGFISSFLDEKVSWVSQTQKRLFYGFVAMVIFNFLAIFSLYKLFIWAFNWSMVNPYSPMPWLIALLMTAIMTSRSFLYSWRQSAINEERFKMENIRSRFEVLKNQVNPHFLFNSFNVLSELVYQDADKAAQFIQQLSDVYRYVLEKRDHEVVLVQDELTFLEKYLFLQQIRFQEGLLYDIEVRSNEAHIPPMTLQLLVENALKHNVVSEDEPLHIKIFEHDDYIEVCNNLQKKRTPEAASGVGLVNIQERYKYLSENEVKIIKTNTSFSVQIPLLKTRDHAHSAR